MQLGWRKLSSSVPGEAPGPAGHPKQDGSRQHREPSPQRGTTTAEDPHTALGSSQPPAHHGRPHLPGGHPLSSEGSVPPEQPKQTVNTRPCSPLLFKNQPIRSQLTTTNLPITAHSFCGLQNLPEAARRNWKRQVWFSGKKNKTQCKRRTRSKQVSKWTGSN